MDNLNSERVSLKKSEERYRLLLDTMVHGVQANDCEGTITLSNRAHHEILGYADGELVGKKIWDVLPSNAEQEELQRYLSSLVHDQPLPTAYISTCLKKDGTPVELRVDWNYERDANGNLTGFISIITDMTHRRRIEENLQQRTQGFSLLIEASKNLAATLDLRHVLQMSVDCVTELVGLDTAAIYLLDGDKLHLKATTPPLPEEFPDEMRIAVLADHPHIQKAIQTAEPVLVPDYLLVNLTPAERAIAETRDLRTLLFVPLLLDQNALGVFIVGSTGKPSILSDVEIDLSLTLASLASLTIKNAQLFEKTTDYAAKLELALSERMSAEEAQRLSEGRYSTLFEYANIGMVVADQESQVIDANPRICQMLGYNRREMTGLHISDIVAETGIRPFEPALKKKNETHGDRSSEFRRKDGSVFEVDVTATILPDGNLVAFVRDLTDQRRAEKEKVELENQLQQAQRMESIGRLAGGVAHDFNNMLSVILGYSDLALQKSEQDAGRHAELVEIRKAAQRSANLTRQLLAFARKQTAAPEILNLNHVIGEMLKMLRRLIGENVDLDWSPGPDLGLVKIDPSQIDQILANLCVNSRDAIPGNGKITIQTGNAVFEEAYCELHPGFMPGAFTMIAVRDDGEGMDQKTIANMFEPYFSTKKAGDGTGLGLSTVYGIVKQNGGFINVSSEIGRGTTFKIYLPQVQDKSDSRPERTSDRLGQGGNETVLLVEDDPMILSLGESMLKSLGYRVFTAKKPIEALKLAQERKVKIDLLITDVVMPDMNGLELAEQLETLIPDLSVLYVSGYTADVVADHGILHDGISFLPKPFSVMDLADKVRQAVGVRESD